MPLRSRLNRAMISIHALLAESDFNKILKPFLHFDFYPRSPCGERHNRAELTILFTQISIHALLAESDEYFENGY